MLFSRFFSFIVICLFVFLMVFIGKKFIFYSEMDVELSKISKFRVAIDNYYSLNNSYPPESEIREGLIDNKNLISLNDLSVDDFKSQIDKGTYRFFYCKKSTSGGYKIVHKESESLICIAMLNFSGEIICNIEKKQDNRDLLSGNGAFLNIDNYIEEAKEISTKTNKFSDCSKLKDTVISSEYFYNIDI